jgi:adenine-specific DNA-methyltransferase
MPLLQFKGKTAIETYHHTVPHHALEFDEKLSVLGKGAKPSLDGNLIIEGDNLLALKALLPTHAGRIKCIYIDPPYNTGNEGWVYNDNLTQPQFKEWIGQVVGKEEEDACRHDKWCCMMYPRLQLLKELLRDDGAIFVSIDDNEVANLRALMDEVFGEHNFVANIVWEKKYSRTNDAQYLSDNHDHILLYAKLKLEWSPEGLPRTPSQLRKFRNPDSHPLGPWQDVVYTCNKTKEERPNLYYPITNPFTKVRVWPDPTRVWYCEPETTATNEREKRIWWGERGEKEKPRLKTFLSEVSQGLVANTIWTRQECGDNQEAERVLREIVPEYKFLGPKPPRLIKRILELATGPDDWILDSFAGSGTTGHSVLELSKSSGGNRRFILVQQPYDTTENQKQKFNLCQRLTAERVRRVVEGYTFEGTKSEPLLEEKIGLNTLKTAEELLKRIENAKAEGKKNFDDVEAKCEDGVVRVTGIKNVKGKTEGLGGSFAYARLSDKPILGEYRDITKHPPAYEEIAKYIFYTETSAVWNKDEADKKTGRIGERGSASFYLLYTPNQKDDQALDAAFLKNVAAKDRNPNLVVYCEKIWIHRSELLEWEERHGKRVRTMIVPFNLK